MVSHLISICLFAIVATSYVCIMTARADAFTENSSVSKITFEALCWMLILLKWVDINTMLIFHRTQIPLEEIDTSFFILLLSAIVTLFITLPIVVKNYRYKFKGVRLILLMQLLILLELLIIGNLIS